MTYHFSINRQSPGNRTDVIVCQEMDLEIEVASGPGELDNPREMILTAIWYHKNSHGDYDPENGDSLTYKIMQPHGDEHLEWSIDLFRQAINWYVVNHLPQKCNDYHLVGSPMMGVYMSDLSDDFDW